MSNISNEQGRAYEYAWMKVLYDKLSSYKNTKIINNSSYLANESAWNSISNNQKDLFLSSAMAAVDVILEMEPILVEISDDEVLIEFQRDEAGIRGDVRDIVIKRNDIDWEVGLSVKHNHEAVKHSRLSYRLDFGKEWYGLSCSKEYWTDINPIFEMLTEQKKNNKKWADLKDKNHQVYKPILNAFINEISRSYQIDSNLPKKMVEYLIGVCDYYKVISMDSKHLTLIRTFNLHGTLNKPSHQKKSSINVPIVDLPSEIIAIRFKSNSLNTVEMYMNNGWQLSFRIHNASTYIEPSLKFDIQFIGLPLSILSIQCKWKQ